MPRKHRKNIKPKVGSNPPLEIRYRQSKGVIAKGGFGKLHEVTLIEPVTLSAAHQSLWQRLKSKRWIKKTVSLTDYNEDEPRILKRYYPTLLIHKVNSEKASWITEYLPGAPLSEKTIEDLTYLQLFTLLAQLATQMNSFHHYTPSTGSAIVHGDIKALNTLIAQIDQIHPVHQTKQSRLHINIIDFGLSFDVKDKPNKLHQRETSSLNPVYFAPEALNGRFGIKTDVYMMGNMFRRLLRDIELTNVFPENISFFLKQFLQRMTAQEYAKRPDSDEVLKFFVTLSNYYQTQIASDKNVASSSKEKSQSERIASEEKNSKGKEIENDADLEEQEEKEAGYTAMDYTSQLEVYETKLALLSSNQWYITNSAGEKETGENINLSDTPNLAKVIIILAKKNILQYFPQLIDEKNSKDFIKAILKLKKHRLLNAATMKSLDRKFCLSINETKDENELFLLLFRENPQSLSSIKLLNITKTITDFSEIDLGFLSHLRGTLAEKRMIGLEIISHMLNTAKTTSEVDDIRTKLKELAKNGKINYLHERQGFFFSIRNDKDGNKKVSHTWVNLMNQITTRRNHLSSQEKRSGLVAHFTTPSH